MEQYTRNTEESNIKMVLKLSSAQDILSALKSFWKNPHNLPHKILFVQQIQKHFLPK